VLNAEIEMKILIGSMLAVAGLAASASAQTRLEIQVSKDGLVWSDSVSVSHAAGDTGRVLVRYLVSYIGTAPAVGFASLTFQPAFGNVRASDEIAPFANQGDNRNGGGVRNDATPLDGPFGRLLPFATTGPTLGGAQSYIVHTHIYPAGLEGRYYRIARNDVTRWAGKGPTSGTDGVNNFNGAGGMAHVQKSPGNVGPFDPPFKAGITDIEILRLAIDVGTIAQGESHTIDLFAPLNGMSRNNITGAREASWFAALSGDSSGRTKGAVEVEGASIMVVPAPGALVLMGLGGLVVIRRRR
jgi:hypothetical protein